MVFWKYMFNDPFIWALDLCVSCNLLGFGDQTCWNQSWFIHCKPRRSHDFSFTLTNTMTYTFALHGFTCQVRFQPEVWVGILGCGVGSCAIGVGWALVCGVVWVSFGSRLGLVWVSFFPGFYGPIEEVKKNPGSFRLWPKRPLLLKHVQTMVKR